MSILTSRRALLAACALLALAVPSTRAGDWTESETSAPAKLYAPIDGDLVQFTGTLTVRTRVTLEDGRYHFHAQYRYDFVSEDGAVRASGITNHDYQYRDAQPRTYSYVYHLSFIEKGRGLVARNRYQFHYTFDAKGEMTAYHVVRLP
jgi:hypothetical protein